MPFRPFTEYGAASRTEITIRTNDLLFVSKITLKQFNDKAKYACLHVDDDNGKVGVQFLTEQPTETNFRKLTEEKAGVSMNIAPVLRYFGIKKLAKKQVLSYQNEGGMLVFSIKELTNKKAANES